MSRIRLLLEDPSGSREFDLPAAGGPSGDARLIESGGELRAVRIGEEIVPVRAARDGASVWVWCRGRTFEFRLAEAGRRRAGAAAAEGLWAPMPGKIVVTRVREGDEVAAGELLLILEAMKMEHEIRAPHAGRIGKLPYGAGEQVEAGALLVEFAG